MVFSSALRGLLSGAVLVGVGLVGPRSSAGAPAGMTPELPVAAEETREESASGTRGEASAPEGERGEEAEEAEAEEAEDDEARKQAALASFEAARRLFLAEDFVGAAAEFRRSFEAFPSLEALLASARAYEQAGETFAAIDAYEEYAEFEDEDAERYASALERLRQLRAQVGELVLRIEDPSQIVGLTMDGEEVAFGDFPMRVMPGEVTLEIRFAEVEKPRVITSRVRMGETTVLEISPRPPIVTQPPPPQRTKPEPPVEVEPPPSLRGLRVAFWGGVGLSAAAGVAVATLGGLTLRQRQIYYEARCPSEVCEEGAVYPFAEEARFGELRRATNIALGAGIGVAVVTLAVGGVLKRRQAKSRRAAQIDLGHGSFAVRF